MQTDVLKNEMYLELTEHLIPFWSALKDQENGGFYGYVGPDLKTDPGYEKGCILNSRILWFFSEAYRLLGSEQCRENALHAFAFLKEKFYDRQYGGVFWSLTADGKPLDETKHTYCQAFAIYALSAYFRACKDPGALALAGEIYKTIEEKMWDENGYGEAFDRTFAPASNEKLSENGVLAQRTMNTLLHVTEAYTEYYRVSGSERVRERLISVLGMVLSEIYDADRKRLGVFFDREYRVLLDLYSCGHDIEAAWLLDRAVSVLYGEGKDTVLPAGRIGEPEDLASLAGRIGEMTMALEEEVFRFLEKRDSCASLPMEIENGVIKSDRVWWIQAETVNGFVNAWQKRPEREEYLEAAEAVWRFIRKYIIDRRPGGEWFAVTDPEGRGKEGQAVADPWKCPYHNGRMCMEIIRRFSEKEKEDS